MKWVKLKNDADPNMSSAEMEQGKKKKFVEIIDIPLSKKEGDTGFNEELKKRLKEKGYGVWATYPENGSIADFPPLGKKATRKYEIFCGGFLYYHDVEFKKYPAGEGISFDSNGKPFLKSYPEAKEKNFEHKIFFEWLPKGKGKKKTAVRIFITETPEKFNVDPPPPPKPPPPEA